MNAKIQLATIKKEFLKTDEADLTFIIVEDRGEQVVVKQLHDHGKGRTEKIVPKMWLNVFDDI